MSSAFKCYAIGGLIKLGGEAVKTLNLLKGF
jgi:hypothetical protein